MLTENGVSKKNWIGNYGEENEAFLNSLKYWNKDAGAPWIGFSGCGYQPQIFQTGNIDLSFNFEYYKVDTQIFLGCVQRI